MPPYPRHPRMQTPRPSIHERSRLTRLPGTVCVAAVTYTAPDDWTLTENVHDARHWVYQARSLPAGRPSPQTSGFFLCRSAGLASGLPPRFDDRVRRGARSRRIGTVNEPDSIHSLLIVALTDSRCITRAERRNLGWASGGDSRPQQPLSNEQRFLHQVYY